MSKEEIDLIKSEGKLRGEKTVWTIEDWLDKKEFPLKLIRKVEGEF